MLAEPPVKRAIAFFDGQNLFHAVKAAFGYTYPNYDAKALAQAICAARGWQLDQVRFYTGVPDPTDNVIWSGFWAARLLAMSRQGIWRFPERCATGIRPSSSPTGRCMHFLPPRKRAWMSASPSMSFAWGTGGITT